MQQVKILNII